MKGEPRVAAKNKRIAGGELERARRIATFVSADPEQAGVAKRQRDDGRCEVLLVAVLVQAHAGVRTIDVDQAGFRRMRIARQRLPRSKHDVGDWWPSGPGIGVKRLIA